MAQPNKQQRPKPGNRAAPSPESHRSPPPASSLASRSHGTRHSATWPSSAPSPAAASRRLAPSGLRSALRRPLLRHWLVAGCPPTAGRCPAVAAPAPRPRSAAWWPSWPARGRCPLGAAEQSRRTETGEQTGSSCTALGPFCFLLLLLSFTYCPNLELLFKTWKWTVRMHQIITSYLFFNVQ